MKKCEKGMKKAKKLIKIYSYFKLKAFCYILANKQKNKMALKSAPHLFNMIKSFNIIR